MASLHPLLSNQKPMNFSLFINKLQSELTKPLPGEAAFAKMSVPHRDMFQANEKTKKSAVLILLYEVKNEIHIPLILRPKYDGVHAGQMAFPGGRYENSDKSLIQTALREAQEEIGIKASDVQVLGELTEMYIAPSNFLVLPIVGVLNYKPDFYPDSREVDTVFEIKLNELMNENIIGTTNVSARGFTFDVPCYNIQEHKIWGATALMISELNTIVESIQKSIK